MKKAVICFTRVPRPGVTKTRLLPVLSPEGCAALHRAFLQDLSRVYGGMEEDLIVAYTPDPDWESLKILFPQAKAYVPQQGAGLGEKMDHAIRQVLEMGYEAVVLTGADLPTMDAGHIRSGFAALEQADIAIGPSEDGGYYLIGMKTPCSAAFRVEGYGGATALENTLAALAAAGKTVGYAKTCDDVDTPEDLRRLMHEVLPESATGRCLEMLKKEGLSL